MKRINVSTELKEFKRKNLLSSSFISSIFGVTEKEVEKWEMGEKGMTVAEATLLEILDSHPDILSSLLYCSSPEKEKKKEKTIPKKYMFKGSYEEGGFRDISPIGKELDKKKLEEIECPCCGEKNLRIKDYGCDSMFPEFVVGCDSCDWDCPIGTISDYGEAPCEFKFWLEAFYLMGRPKEKVNEDLTFYFYPEEEGWREKERKNK